MNLELFSCAGGMAEGFRQAGVHFDMVVDWDAGACASYEANLGHRPVRMDARDLLRLARLGWRPSEAIELFVADPPCTPWSRAGRRRGLADPRDCLIVTVELIRLLRPRCYLIGNVPGLQDSTSWPIVQQVIGGLHADDYCVADYASLDAADYGVPQHRVRPFWFGHLDGPCIVWPAATHGPPSRQETIPGAELKPWVTCRQALRRLPVDQLGRPVRVGRGGAGDARGSQPLDGGRSGQDADQEHARGRLDRPFGGALRTNGKHRPNTPDEPSMTVTAKGDGRGAQGACVLVIDEAPLVGSARRRRRASSGSASASSTRRRQPSSATPMP